MASQKHCMLANADMVGVKPTSSICIGVDLYNQTLTGGVSKTLNNRATDSDHVPCVLILNDQGGGVMHVSYDVTSTLRSQTKHHEPVVLVYDARGNGGVQYAQQSQANTRTE